MKYFSHVFVINLDRRQDRLDLITKQLSRVGIEAERVSAVDGNLLDPDPKIGNGWNHRGVAGCALSHRKIIELAKERQYANFLVIEDDTVFCEDFLNKIDSYMQQVPNDWDMLYFGGNHLSQLKPQNINVGKCTHTLTTNCYAMQHSLYDEVLKHLPNNVVELVKPIDSLYTDFQKNNNFNIYSFKPHLVWQDSIFSDIENKSQDLPFLRPNHDKISLIISSCNQKKRLKFSLLSAIKQNYYNYEVIVADDNSQDGTVDMIKSDFPGVILSTNPNSEQGTYTLAQNWNAAAAKATGTRLIFTNADCVFPSVYVPSHADKNMSNDIIFGPNERTEESIEPLLDRCLSTRELLEEYLKIGEIGTDLRHDSSAYTYNNTYNYYYPWGNNMSVPSKEFYEVGGFPLLREYGGEEILLSKKLCARKKLTVKSNVHTKNIHLWHPITNSMKAPFDERNHDEYINS